MATDLTSKISDLSTRVGEEFAGMKPATLHSPADSRDGVLAAGEEFAVPAYAVGSHRLSVYLDGVLCAEGETYAEISSTAISFVDDIPTTFDIFVRVG